MFALALLIFTPESAASVYRSATALNYVLTILDVLIVGLGTWTCTEQYIRGQTNKPFVAKKMKKLRRAKQPRVVKSWPVITVYVLCIASSQFVQMVSEHSRHNMIVSFRFIVAGVLLIIIGYLGDVVACILTLKELKLKFCPRFCSQSKNRKPSYDMKEEMHVLRLRSSLRGRR